jgi:hypothetical protein
MPGPGLQPAAMRHVLADVTWLVGPASSLRYALVGTVMAALVAAAAVLVCVAVPWLIVRSRLAKAR